MYVSDGLGSIPEHERWNLVVGNPPHSGSDEVRPEIKRPTAIYQDAGWRIHEDFYASVGAHLAPLLGQLVRPFELLQAPSDIGRLAVVVVDSRVGQALLRFAVGALDLVDELVNGHVEKRTARFNGA